MGEVSDFSVKQSEGVDVVTNAIRSLDSAAQESAAGSQELAAAAQESKREADALARNARIFKVSDGTPRATI